MTLSNNSTMIKHTRGKHLSYEERVLIQIRRKDNRSMRSIARELGCSPQTISNEIKRGTVSLYHESVKRYKAEVGQKAYQIIVLILVVSLSILLISRLLIMLKNISLRIIGLLMLAGVVQLQQVYSLARM